jgi:hypothetical protein
MRSLRAWVIAAPASVLASLQPLLDARARRQPVLVLKDRVDEVLANPAAFLPANAEALLIVGPSRRGPRRTLPGLWVSDREGNNVPVGWLPACVPRLHNYATAAARTLGRVGRTGPLVVLGQWEDRFLRVALRTSRWLGKYSSAPPVFQWTADRISRPDMIEGLTCGPGVAMYYGHGRASGWAGYHGVRADHFSPVWTEPIGGLLALSCENASRRYGRLSFAEELVLRGVCAGALAGAGKTSHRDNRELGPALCEALIAGTAETLADLIFAAKLPENFWHRTPYRFIGDPAAPLYGAENSIQKAGRVFAPAPDDVLPPWPDEFLPPVHLVSETASLLASEA